MDALDLRIGNLIQCKYKYPNDEGDGYFTETTVKPNDLHDRSKEHPEGYCPINLYPDNYKPIPLTEEWLLKFKTSNETDYFIRSTCTDNPQHEFGFDFGDGFWVLRELRYVHELQNLYFALTQKELTIK